MTPHDGDVIALVLSMSGFSKLISKPTNESSWHTKYFIVTVETLYDCAHELHPLLKSVCACVCVRRGGVLARRTCDYSCIYIDYTNEDAKTGRGVVVRS